MPMAMARNTFEWLRAHCCLFGLTHTRDQACARPLWKQRADGTLGLISRYERFRSPDMGLVLDILQWLIMLGSNFFILQNGLSKVDKNISSFWWTFPLARNTTPSFLEQPYLWPLLSWESGSMGGDNGQKECPRARLSPGPRRWPQPVLLGLADTLSVLLTLSSNSLKPLSGFQIMALVSLL